MQIRSEGEVVFLRLFPGEDICSSIARACKENKVVTAIILSGIGQIKDFELSYFKEKGNYLTKFFQVPHELLSLSGNIVSSENGPKLHLHAVLSDDKHNAIGGHLGKSEVSVTAEICLLTTKIPAYRKKEEKTGLEGLFLE